MRLEALQSLAFLLGSLALLDVGERAVPLHDPALLVAQGHGLNEEPAVFARRASVARFILEWHARGQRMLPLAHVTFDVGGMNDRLPSRIVIRARSEEHTSELQ